MYEELKTMFIKISLNISNDITYSNVVKIKLVMLPGWLSGKESTCQTGDKSSVPGLGRSPGEGNGNLLHSCLGNPKDRGAWWSTVPGVAKSQT